MPHNVIGSTRSKTYVGDKNHLVFDEQGRLYGPLSTSIPVVGLYNEIQQTVQAITYTTDGVLSSTAINPYGITYIAPAGAAPSSDNAKASMAAPIVGVEKTIILGTTVAGSLILDVDLGAATIAGSSGFNIVAFSSLFASWQAVTLIGLTTALWHVKGIMTASSSNNTWGATGGIRGTTAARTS